MPPKPMTGIGNRQAARWHGCFGKVLGRAQCDTAGDVGRESKVPRFCRAFRAGSPKPMNLMGNGRHGSVAAGVPDRIANIVKAMQEPGAYSIQSGH